MIPVPLPSPVLCLVHVRNPVTNTDDRRSMWVAAFTDVDPLGEQPGQDGDGVPLIVTDTGLRTPEQHAADIGHVLLSWSLAWPQQQAAPGGGLLIANGVPRLN